MSDDPTKKLPGEGDDSAGNEDRLDLLINMVQSLATRMQNIEAEFHGVKTRLETLEQTVSARLYETKPLWERALAEIAETRADMKEYFQRFSSKVDILTRDVFAVR